MSCRDQRPPPGIIRISVARGNITRNRLEGAPNVLPAIIVEQDGRKTYADRVELTGPATVVQSENAVWIETKHAVLATVDGAKT